MDMISVIVPCYNEEKVLDIFYKKISEIVAQMSDIEFEIIFIDDGSTDESLLAIKKIYENSIYCRYLSFSRNFGKDAALYAGLSYAKGDYIVFIDADLQDPPVYIKEMYNILKTGKYDCVAARRIDRTGEKKLRSFLSAMFYKIMNLLTDISIKDGARDYRMITRQVADALLQLKEYSRFSKGLFGWVGFRTKWIEFHNVERIAGDTKWSVFQLFRYAFDGILSFSTVPLSLVSYTGLVFCVVSFMLVLILVMKNLIWHDPVAGWASTMCVILVVSGIQLLCMGMIGQYVARMFTEVKKRPVYIIKEESGKNVYDEISFKENVE